MVIIIKKIYIFAYVKNNLGDDLFIKYLIKKFYNVSFYIHIPDDISSQFIEKMNNVKILKQEEVDINYYDAFIYIGGSIFMEFDQKSLERMEKFKALVYECNNNNIPFFYISPNFGPYKTNKYLNMAKSTFENCEDICFRDLYSYLLFKDIPSVRYAPDLLFSYPIPEIEKEKDTVGISVINLEIKKMEEYKNQYYKILENSIREYIKKGKIVTLFSFCKREKDEATIQDLLCFFSEQEKKYINIQYYRGNDEEFLLNYAKMEYMLCSRFHAMILSCLLQQKYYVLSYSKKINNVIEDLNLCKKYSEISSINTNNLIPIENFETTNYELIKNITEKSKEQFKGIIQFLEI